MNISELEQAILDIISKLYCKLYIGKIKVEQLLNDKKEHLGFLLKLELNKKDKPYTLSVQGDHEQFLKIVKEQLRIGQFGRVDYFEAFLV